MRKAVLLGVFWFVISGCAPTNQVITASQEITASPLSEIVWDGSVVSQPFSVPRPQMVKDIYSLINGADDETTKYVYSEIDKKVPQSLDTVSFADRDSCQEKVNYLNKKLEAIAQELPNSVSYVLKYNTGTGTSVHPSIEKTVSATAQPDGSYLQIAYTDMKWVWSGGAGKASGFAKINVVTKTSCDDKNDVYFKVSVPECSIKNPTLWLAGQKIAELSINFEQVKNSIAAISKKHVFGDGQQQYSASCEVIARGINYQLKNRFKKDKLETIKDVEHIYKVAYDVMLSRIQRNLESYKYTAEKTRYELSEKISVHNIDIDVITIIKIYPEEGGKCSVIFSLEYPTVYDNLAKTNVFGKSEAQKYLQGQVRLFDKVIVYR